MTESWDWKNYKILSEKYAVTKEKYDEATESIEQKKSKKVLFKAFIKNLEDADSLIEEFDRRVTMMQPCSGSGGKIQRAYSHCFQEWAGS